MSDDQSKAREDGAAAEQMRLGVANLEAPSTPMRDVFFALGLATLVIVILSQAAEFLAPMALAVLIWFLINAVANGIRSAPGIGPRIPEGFALALAAVLIVASIVYAGRLVVENFFALAQQLQIDAGLFETSDGALGDDLDAPSADAIGARLELILETAARKLMEAVSSLFGTPYVQFELPIEVVAEYVPFSSIAGGTISFIASMLSGISMVLLLVLFLLFDQPYYGRKLRALFPDVSRREKAERVLAKIAADTRVYVWIMTVVSVAVGLATYAITEYYGLPGSVFWGFLAFALNYIPTIGTFLGIVFPAVFALAQLPVGDALIVIGILLVVQFVVGNIVLPRMTGEQLNLSEFVVILSLLVWGVLWGPLGMFLAVPMMMVTAIVLAQFDSTRPVAVLLSKTGKVGRA